MCGTYQVCAAPVERFPSTKTAFLVLGTRFFPFPSTEMAFLVLGPTFIPTLAVVMADLIGHLFIPGPDPGSPVRNRHARLDRASPSFLCPYLTVQRMGRWVWWEGNLENG